MEVNDYISIISVITTCIVGIILFRQIKSQREIINNLKTYMEIFDIDQIKKLIEFRHETTMNAAKTYLKDEVKEFIQPKLNDVADEMKDLLLASMGDKFDELAQFAFEYIVSLPKRKQKAFIREYFELNKDIFFGALEAAEKNEVETSNV